MKGKEIALDFTPLLDVTLILLFFFLLFTTFEVQEAKNNLNSQVQAAQERLEEANALYEDAAGLVSRVEEELSLVEAAGSRGASNIEALLEFNRGANVKLILSMGDGTAKVRIFQGEKLLATAAPDADLAGIICAKLKEAGYQPEDTVLCEFVLDGSEAGTASAYRKIKQNLLYIKGEFHYFYYSETDISMGED